MGNKTKHILQPQQSALETGNRALHAWHPFSADVQYDDTRMAKPVITLDGVAAKLARAEHGIDQLSQELSNFCARLRDNTTMVERPDLARIQLEFHGPTPTLPLAYSIYLGEIAYNLRSALDHLIWQLALANYKLPTRSNEFPIFSDKQKYKSAAKRKLVGVSNESIAAIALMQPFLNDPKWLPLEALQSFSNFDKHRTLHLLQVRWDLLVDNESDQNVTVGFSVPMDQEFEVQTGQVLCSIPRVSDVQLIPLFDVRLTDSHFDGVVGRRQVNDQPHAARVLRRLLNTVREVVDVLKWELLTSPFLGPPQKFGITAIDIPDTYENRSFNEAPKFIRDLLALRYVQDEEPRAAPIDATERHWISFGREYDSNAGHIHIEGEYPASFNGTIHRTNESVTVKGHSISEEAGPLE